MREYDAGLVRAVRNERKSAGPGPACLSGDAVANALRVHRAYAGYKPTPLLRLDAMARRLGVRAVFVKDESQRFGLNAFKGLGGMYALFCVACRALGLDAHKAVFEDLRRPEVRRLVFITATDGNHGRGVAWAAAGLGCRAHVLMPKGSSEARAEAIRAFGAECRVTEVGYDDTVREAARLARENGWFLVQDTSWEGYEEVPLWIVQGYTTMALEAAGQLGSSVPTHVFLQAGVGAMAGGVTGFLANLWAERRPEFCIVEPERAACVYASALAADGAPHAAADAGGTIMAGLNCAEPCTIMWPVLRDFAGWFLKCPDCAAAYGMRLLGAPEGSDPRIVSGESGAVTAGVLNLLALDPACAELRRLMGLGPDSVVLLFSTEGDTDPENYRRIVHRGAWPLPDTPDGRSE